jgi:hypothetical protein
VPGMRAQAGDNISRVVRYLESNSWGAYDHNSPRITAPFGPNPDVLWAFVKAANLADRARWSWLHDPNVELSRIFWFPMWMSSREVHDGYFKYNLMHSTMAILVSTEADPALYREYLKGVEIMRETTGHHMNAWFDSVYAMAVPSAASLTGLVIKGELEHWALRERRSVFRANSADPTIAKTLYHNPNLPAASSAKWVATYPLPIELRAHGDFTWQTDPYQLDGGWGGATKQHPGVDLVLPYWVGKSYGLWK